MPITVPPATNYQSPLVAIQTVYRRDPQEGDMMIACEADWGTMGGSGTEKAISFNLQNNSTLSFSQICAISVDNSDCGADVRFVFTDTAYTVTIPAYSPLVICEVFTNSKSFYLTAGFDGEVVEGSDVTRFQIHNSLPPPVSIPTSLEQDTSQADNIDATVAGSTALIPAGVNGTLETLSVVAQLANTTGDIGAWTIQDGSGNIVAGSQVVSSSAASNVPPFVLPNIRVRFTNGLNFVITSTNLPAGSKFGVNIFYRKP